MANLEHFAKKLQTSETLKIISSGEYMHFVGYFACIFIFFAMIQILKNISIPNTTNTTRTVQIIFDQNII